MAFNQFEITRKIIEMGPYRTGTSAGAAFMLTKATGKKRKLDGAIRYEQVGSITINDLAEIGRSSPNLMVAAQRAIARCLKQPDPHPTSNGVPMAPLVDEADLQARIQDGVEKALQRLNITPENLEMLRTIETAKKASRQKKSRAKAAEPA